MARRRRRSLPDRLARQYRPQARLEAELQYGPQRRELGAALGEAQSARDQSVAAAHGTSRGLRATIRAQRGSVKDLYADTGSKLRANADAVLPAIVGVSGPASAIAQAAAGEHQAALDANTVARGNTLQNYADQLVRARAGEAFAVRQAQQVYGQDAGKILGQLAGVAEDQGKYTATELGRLVDTALGRQVTLRGQTLAHRDRRQSELETHRHNVAAEDNQRTTARQRQSDAGFLSPTQQAKAQDAVHQALNEVHDFKRRGLRRHEVAQTLRSGVDDQTLKPEPLYDPATGKAKVDPKTGQRLYRDPLSGKTTTSSQPVKVPGVQAVESEATLQAALDIAYDGFLSKRTQTMLRKAGIRVRRLGVPTYGSHRGQHLRGRQRQQQQVEAHGGAPSTGAAGFPVGAH